MVAIKSQEPPKQSVDIVSRLLFDRSWPMSPELANHILAIEISADDRARISDLMLRNQADLLSAAEKDELQSYLQAGALLDLFQAQARQVSKSPLPKPRRKR